MIFTGRLGRRSGRWRVVRTWLRWRRHFPRSSCRFTCSRSRNFGLALVGSIVLPLALVGSIVLALALVPGIPAGYERQPVGPQHLLDGLKVGLAAEQAATGSAG